MSLVLDHYVDGESTHIYAEKKPHSQQLVLAADDSCLSCATILLSSGFKMAAPRDPLPV